MNEKRNLRLVKDFSLATLSKMFDILKLDIFLEFVKESISEKLSIVLLVTSKDRIVKMLS